MKSTDLRTTIALAIALLLVQLPVAGATSPIGKVVPRSGSTVLNGIEVSLETTVFSGDTVATQADSLALIQLPQGDQIHIGPSSSATVTAAGNELLVSLERGMTLARSGNARQVSVNALGLLVQPSGLGSYEVAIDSNSIVVASHEGNVQVQGANKSFEVPAGKVMRFELAANTSLGRVGVGARNITPGVSAAIGAAVGGGIALTLYLIERSQREDDDEEVCQRIKSQISPSSAGAGIDCSF